MIGLVLMCVGSLLSARMVCIQCTSRTTVRTVLVCTPPSPLSPNATNITPGDGMYSWMWALAEYNTGIIVACMPSMLLFLRWARGDMDPNKKLISGSNPTIGGGGVRGRPARKTETSEMDTRTGMAHENDEYGMRDVGGIIKSKELVTVETASDREGSMC